MNDFISQISSSLTAAPDRDAGLKNVLRIVLDRFQSETGTIHLLDRDKQLLHLTAETGLPPAMIEIVRTVPVGKGIAGQTAERGEPITMCNLQTDQSGVARPGARQTGVGGALCVPIRNNGVIVGTIGVGTVRQYQYTEDETRLLEEVGRAIGSTVQHA